MRLRLFTYFLHRDERGMKDSLRTRPFAARLAAERERLERGFRRPQATVAPSATTSRRGGAPNIRAYSRLNCEGLS